MRPGFIAKSYQLLLSSTYEKVYIVSTKAAWKGRVLSVFLGIALTCTIPIVKLLSFLEAFLFTIANLFAPVAPKYCSFYDAWLSFKYSGYFFIGFILSPITAIFVGSAVILSMMTNPIKASKKLAETSKLLK